MLALTDAQLGMLAIAATAVEPDQRRRWLKDLAERIDLPPPPHSGTPTHGDARGRDGGVGKELAAGVF